MERRVGEIFEYQGKILRVKEAEGKICEGCLFLNKCTCETRDTVGRCGCGTRSDKKNVIFVELKEQQETEAVKERKIGEKFDYYGKTLEVVQTKSDTCYQCCFKEETGRCSQIKSKTGVCDMDKRTDRRPVIFIEVKDKTKEQTEQPQQTEPQPNLNLGEILKDCPKGWKFWSPIFGEVEFVRNYRDKGFVNVSIEDSSEWSFASDATIFFGNIKSREVMLYPSKELRDWSKFTAPWYKKDNFKVGDWIISSVLGIAHIIGVNDSNEYQLEYIDGKQKFSSIDYVNYEYDKWTIKNAKDGDVVQLGQIIAIFKKYIGEEKCICYCSFCKDVGFEIPIENGEDNVYGCYNATPAIRKYRDYLMKAMNDAGYEWDVENKDFKKLVPNRFDPKTLKAFDKVIIRHDALCEWEASLFSHRNIYYENEDIYSFCTVTDRRVMDCIPYNDDTKHLVGTTDEAPEYYRYWEK